MIPETVRGMQYMNGILVECSNCREGGEVRRPGRRFTARKGRGSQVLVDAVFVISCCPVLAIGIWPIIRL